MRLRFFLACNRIGLNESIIFYERAKKILVGLDDEVLALFDAGSSSAALVAGRFLCSAAYQTSRFFRANSRSYDESLPELSIAF